MFPGPAPWQTVDRPLPDRLSIPTRLGNKSAAEVVKCLISVLGHVSISRRLRDPKRRTGDPALRLLTGCEDYVEISPGLVCLHELTMGRIRTGFKLLAQSWSVIKKDPALIAVIALGFLAQVVVFLVLFFLAFSRAPTSPTSASLGSCGFTRSCSHRGLWAASRVQL